MEENNKLKMIKTILIIREVYSKSIGTVSISLIFMLFAADKGLFALMRELHFMEV